jgi:prepilin-type N-terminal cleavage/methylation domain-containing protein
MKERGFTLIELLIVVAIIALIGAIAVPSMLRSRMTANETAAVAACKAFADAEEIYHRTDYTHDGVLKYATALRGDNSLLETSSGLADLGLIDTDFGKAEGDPLSGTPKAGYVFTVLTSQGPAATGGSYCYVTVNNGEGVMVLGFGLSAVAGSYGGTGQDTFIINNNGVVFQKDRGESDTGQETWFNPDLSLTGGWTPIQ